MDTDIRWHQRLQNFDRAFVLLRSALEEKAMERFSALEQEGMIQRFQYTYELAWKTMRDYLESEGIHITPVTPRNVIKEAFAAGIIDDGQVWIDMMLHRNLLSHTYDHDRFREVLMALEQRYLAAFAALHEWLLAQRI
uniref:Nucleotidyltransferase substrate binding protein, HI0074 family n=1 Tax=Candidatus Kentrum sp. MB TaxID=2138164 RepID=A0A450XRP8_9GAMM|nr:MAG: nucleotidyltransferase substrate binding protein, HI0074 family [Candidatus Kentron sp. MB]